MRMIRSYLTLVLRGLYRDKSYSFINIFGLAMGLSVCLLITLYVMDELSYDRFNEKSARIFRINGDISVHGNGANDIYSPAPMGATLAHEYPAVENYTRIIDVRDILVKNGNTTIIEPDCILADSTLFDVFTLPFVAGDPHTALLRPFDMVISESAAKKYFHSASTDVLGKTLHVNNESDYRITGIIKDMPKQSHFRANFIRSIAELNYDRQPDAWLNNGFITYVLLRPGATQSNLDHSLTQLTKKYIIPGIQDLFNGQTGDLLDKKNRFNYYSIPLTRIHLWSHLPSETGNGNSLYVYIFTIIAAFILLIACVNFMNLSTARSARRAKEVGIRKVLGSLRSELITRFLTESLLTSVLAMLIALVLAILLLPGFNRLADKQITFSFLTEGWLLPYLLGITLIVGLLAGLYPAFFLSAFMPQRVMKGNFSAGFRSGWLRNALVVFQFTIAIILIIGTMVIYRQLDYVRHKDIGYNREQILIVRNTYSLWTHAKNFQKEVEHLPGVLGTTMTFFLPTYSGSMSSVYYKDAALSADQTVLLSDWPVDANYISVLGMKMLDGHNFEPGNPTDSSGVIINETASNLLGYNNPIGATIYDRQYDGRVVPHKILGVVKDFNSGTLHSKIPPMMLHLAEERGSLAIRVKTTDMPGLIAHIEKAFRAWDKMSDQPFPYEFMDQAFNRLYRADQRTGTLFCVFAAFAICIGCLGLFGLVSYAAEQRTKEIGIRKVLGASTGNILGMLSKEFMLLIVLSSAIACPIAGWGMDKWLDDFAYRTDISWWIFAAAGGMAALITVFTIGLQALRAARTKPITSLRNE
ncbi:MAG: ABC transporter permease [Bacteroidetes bacterium]|nr:ABC transporter permease [Bacteroidota bacterium]